MKIVDKISLTRIGIFTLWIFATIANSASAATLNIQQLMSMFSTLEGYSFVFRGLSENGIDLESLETNPLSFNYSFSESNATLNSSGIVNGQSLSLSYSGSLSGNYPNEDMTWSGTWSGSLGSSTIEATDTGTFLFNSAIGGYDGFDFRQSGTLDDTGITTTNISPAFLSRGWIVAGAEAIGGGLAGAAVGCWAALVGCFPGIIGGSGIALGVSGVVATIDGDEPDEPVKPPIDDPDPDHKTEVDGDGKADTTLKIPGPNGDIILKTNSPNCDLTGTCNSDGSVTFSISIPEPSSIVGILALGILGGGAILKRKLKSANYTEK